MRGFLASSIGVATAAALALPLALSTPALAIPSMSAVAAVAPAGSTQSLPLVPLGPSADRSPGVPGMSAAPRLPETRGLSAREVKTFSLVGVVWDDASAELFGRVQVRTRAKRTAVWSDWQDVETHNSEHAADLDSAERGTGKVRGSTAPLWVGESDGVEVRVQAEPGATRVAGRAAGRLPQGMRIELVDPGESASGAADGKNSGADDDPAGDGKGEAGAAAPGMTMEMAEASSANLPHAPLGADEIPELDKADSTADAVFAGEGTLAAAAAPYIGPRPRIVTRKGWGADEGLREKGFVYTNTVKAAFVHHTVSGNNYACKDAPAVIRSLYRYHVLSSGWRDFGYNFAVDKCGTIYEGRAGGVTKAVLGAHTMGFNTDSMGVAVLGTFTTSAPPAAAVKAVAQLTAWKLGLFGRDPRAKTSLKSGGGNRFPKGTVVSMNVISGHRDGFATECPGKKLYGQLPPTRTTSAKLQGRP
ncbi:MULTISPECIES: N-acetylmuramoyl-L-alanine amidase [unclassified Streptomyces]|uniref:N-acetylmuramoyl-L-alanine amidase n=1 Tax=unclassified Streptomyces TaxID=2593676 RepID=UPI002253973E|nr:MULTISPECIES: N-acetylmuramoyl-L-alanine amidase [unclassified Streptomyces]MCX4526160.1 N-acetylmuramoyl-L-alanine amidase [Streptomyces sp. NBC_01551]MCX4543276.1 N-acetylmuramoyl-L-alanine amidase [Streptomyces sp. NBC_01565]